MRQTVSYHQLIRYHSAVERGKALASIDSLRTAVDGRSRWYAVYTLPRHEKMIAQRLIQREVETFLPLYRAVHRWNRRRAEVELPLFPGYVFVKMFITNKVWVLSHPGVIRLVSFNGRPATLPDDEIETLRSSLAICKAEPYPFLSAGRQVRIKSGPLAGLEGRVLRRKGRLRVVVSIELIERAIVLELDAADAQLTVQGNSINPRSRRTQAGDECDTWFR
jgi:transcription antitermination factor NusG